MLIQTLALLLVIGAVAFVIAAYRPQPVRARRQPTREEMLAKLLAEREESARW